MLFHLQKSKMYYYKNQEVLLTCVDSPFYLTAVDWDLTRHRGSSPTLVKKEVTTDLRHSLLLF